MKESEAREVQMSGLIEFQLVRLVKNKDKLIAKPNYKDVLQELFVLIRSQRESVIKEYSLIIEQA